MSFILDLLRNTVEIPPPGKTTYHIKGPVCEKHLHVLSFVEQGWLCRSTGCL